MNVIDLDAIHQLSDVAVMRAAAFLSLGLSKVDPDRPWYLDFPSQSLFRFFEGPLPDGFKEHVEKEFHSWMTGAALRELHSGYGLFLDEIFRCLEAASKGTNSPGVVDNAAWRRFTKCGNLGEKLETLADRFGIKVSMSRHFRTISKARNCIEHAAARVRASDVNQSGEFRITWMGSQIEVADAETEVVLGILDQSMMPFEITSENGAVLQVRTMERALCLRTGNPVEFSVHQLYEILAMFRLQATEVRNGAIKYAEERGLLRRKQINDA